MHTILGANALTSVHELREEKGYTMARIKSGRARLAVLSGPPPSADSGNRRFVARILL